MFSRLMRSRILNAGSPHFHPERLAFSVIWNGTAIVAKCGMLELTFDKALSLRITPREPVLSWVDDGSDQAFPYVSFC